MNLHKNPELFRQAIIATSQQIGIPEIYIEKDYWVVFALKAIFEGKTGEYAVFKGGTALSKCFRLIDRFSEDIDIAVKHIEEESQNSRKNKIKQITQTVAADGLTETEIAGVSCKMGMNRKTCHEYPIIFSGDFGQARDKIIVEATWLGNFEPNTEASVSTYIFEMIQKTGSVSAAEQYGLLPFNVKVLRPERTMCDKIMSLVRFSYDENPIQSLSMKIRHTYDLFKLLENKDISNFFNSGDFDEMLRKVAADDILSYKNNNGWLTIHPSKSLIFADTDEIWNRLKRTYNNDFKPLVYGDFPDEGQIHQTLISIRRRLNNIEWAVG